jgi:hypothetical protein
MAAYTAIDDAEVYFRIKLYTGNGTDDTGIVFDTTDTTMQPDLVWIKNRNSTNEHNLVNSVVGATKYLHSNLTQAETTAANSLQSFDSNGFTLGTNANFNTDTNTYVAWCWKAGTSFSNDASATSVGSIDSTGSTSSDSGFSIVSYTGTGADGTIAHNLGAAPTVIIQKNRDEVQPWWVFHSEVGAGGQLRLNDNVAAGTDGGVLWNSTVPTSTVFSVGDNDGINGDGDKCIAYCFVEKQGFSKFGAYTGDGDADGPFVYTGFRPAMVIIKSTGLNSWELYDIKRNTFNPTAKAVFSDGNGAEYDYTNRIDILSNGFKARSTSSGVNGSGVSYTYMAFAESPFVNSEGVPTNAR